jgi:hypothetical protein
MKLAGVEVTIVRRVEKRKRRVNLVAILVERKTQCFVFWLVVTCEYENMNLTRRYYIEI